MILALESTVIAHGLPRPINKKTAFHLQDIAYKKKCLPKTIGIVNGQIRVGLTDEEIILMSERDDIMKAGTREIALAVATKKWAATTVSATIRIASAHSIKVFATGGIGGVHDVSNWDVSQDIYELSQSRMIVVSSGPKSILNLPATAEMLETFEITVLGFRTDEMPAFYTRSSGIKIQKVEETSEIAEIFRTKEKLELPGSVLVFNPIQQEFEIDQLEMRTWLSEATKKMQKENVSQKSVTPFLLKTIAELSEGRTITSNVKLLESNVALACDILHSLSKIQ